MAKAINLTGMKFGRLTVIKRVENRGRNACWLCECDCGNTYVGRADHLKNGNTKSCGCLNSEVSSKRMKKLNVEQWQNEDFKEMQREKMRKQFTGNKNPNYRGNITPIAKHLRERQKNWFNDCKQQTNYKCQLTNRNSRELHTHHLLSFNIIVDQAHKEYNIIVKETVSEYTNKELELLENYVDTWHKNNNNAVVLCKEVHNLFHKLYGKGNNTPEQYIEFKERYLAGEFKEILK